MLLSLLRAGWQHEVHEASYRPDLGALQKLGAPLLRIDYPVQPQVQAPSSVEVVPVWSGTRVLRFGEERPMRADLQTSENLAADRGALVARAFPVYLGGTSRVLGSLADRGHPAVHENLVDVAPYGPCVRETPEGLLEAPGRVVR